MPDNNQALVKVLAASQLPSAHGFKKDGILAAVVGASNPIAGALFDVKHAAKVREIVAENATLREGRPTLSSGTDKPADPAANREAHTNQAPTQPGQVVVTIPPELTQQLRDVAARVAAVLEAGAPKPAQADAAPPQAGAALAVKMERAGEELADMAVALTVLAQAAGRAFRAFAARAAQPDAGAPAVVADADADAAPAAAPEAAAGGGTAKKGK